MQVSLKWLRDYVDVDVSPEELADRLTMSGLEVDSVNRIEPAFSGVRVARIEAIRQHPGADNLSLCEVTTGDGSFSVVCGASNISVGDKVPLAPAGAVLPGLGTVRSITIREVASDGMLCSEQELGIGSDASGVMILDAGLKTGQDLAEALDLGDLVFEIGVTPNRSDCLSMLGVAREVAAITGKELRYPSLSVVENGEETGGITSVVIEDPDLCPRYTARIIKNVRIGPSPFWMRRKLEAVGIRSINNIVDATNFVMMELGQPLHAFDFRFLAEGRIVVRRSRFGETFVSLDGKERILGADTLMICDGVKPVAIGGVMGGLNSEVKDDTETILLESAYFNPVAIRRTARFLGMGTDAAFRFERGIDPEGLLRALDRAAALMAELSGGSVCRGTLDQHPGSVAVAGEIPLRLKRVREIVGIDVPEGEIVRILKSLEMKVAGSGIGLLKVVPPTCRVDITREIDIIEEVIRLYGYDRVQATLPAVSVVAAETSGGQRKVEATIREVMAGAGYSEVINYSFIPQNTADLLGLAGDDERRRHVCIRNPLTEEQSVMRTTLIYSLLRNAARNADVGRFDMKIFEIGRTFISIGEGKLPSESNRSAFLITGHRYEERWHSADLKADFYDLRGSIENILDLLKVPNPSFRSGGAQAPFLHPGKACCILSGEREIGFMGEVHPDVLSRNSLTGTVAVCEIDIDMLAERYSPKIACRAIPRFPSSSRDVAFLVGREVEAGELVRAVTESREGLLEKVQIFDVYEGKNIPLGTRSLGLRFSYRSAERTLTESDVNEVHERVVKKIVHVSGASVR